jgi:hypothetical protein
MMLNIAVLVFSGSLAICFLLLLRATRVWKLPMAQANQHTEAPVKRVVARARRTASLVRTTLSGG